MIEARPRGSLGATCRGDVEALHHFCFAGYHASNRESWGALCVLNHVTLAPHAELRPQPIDGVELISIVRKGVIAHSGSLGGHCRTIAGEVRLISPGPGITHGEVNPANRPAEFVEIRIHSQSPGERALRKIVKFPGRNHTGHLILLASGFPEDRPAMTLNAPARVFGARVSAKGALTYTPKPGTHVYVMSLKGRISVNGLGVEPLAGAAAAGERLITIETPKFAEIVLIDVW